MPHGTTKTTAASAIHPLPLSSTLHDLALLRASDLDFSSLLPAQDKKKDGSDGTASESEVDASVEKSLEFSREARAALKLLHSDAVEREGSRLEEVRGRLEDAMAGLEADDE